MEKSFFAAPDADAFFHTPMSDFSSASVVDAVRFGVVKLLSMRSVDGLGLFSPYRARCASCAFLSVHRVGAIFPPFLEWAAPW